MRAAQDLRRRRIAERGGVIGIWPLSTQFSTLNAYASALIDTASTVGAAHVGVGTDMYGLGGQSSLPGYEQFPQLEEILLKRGVKPDEVRGILGGNYLRALAMALSG